MPVVPGMIAALIALLFSVFGGHPPLTLPRTLTYDGHSYMCGEFYGLARYTTGYYNGEGVDGTEQDLTVVVFDRNEDDIPVDGLLAFEPLGFGQGAITYYAWEQQRCDGTPRG